VLLDDEIRTAIVAAGKSVAAPADASVADARALQRRMAAAFTRDTNASVAARDIAVASPTGTRTYRFYTPQQSTTGPLVVFVHGGGWIGGDLDTHDSLCRTLAEGSGCALLALTYRRAPEHRFPAPLDDCIFGARWSLDHAASLECTGPVAIMGESAGANLATAAQLALAREDGQRFAFQLLAYPATDLRILTPAFGEPHDPLSLTLQEALWCRSHYLTDAEDVHDWRASPILAPNLPSSPTTHILTAGVDPLRDDGAAYAEALRAAGVTTTHACYPDLPHGFLSLPRSIARVAAAQDRVAEHLRSHLT
jgi:acetyl esterase